MSHLVEERLDVVPAEQTRPAMAHAGKVRHEDDHRQLKATGPSATRSAHDPEQMLGRCVGRQLRTRAELYIQVRVILVDAPRAPHGVMRGTGRLSLARVQVTVNRANHAAFRLVDHLELQHIGVPHFPRLRLSRTEVDAVQEVKQARQARKHRAERQVRRQGRQMRRLMQLEVRLRVKVAVPNVHVARAFQLVLQRAEFSDHLLRSRPLGMRHQPQKARYVLGRSGHLVHERHFRRALLASEPG